MLNTNAIAQGVASSLVAAAAVPAVASPMGFGLLSDELLKLTASINAPEDLISDVKLNNRDSRNLLREYGEKSLERCEMDLKVQKAREACNVVLADKKPYQMSRDIAVTKFGVGLCREKCSVLLLELAKRGVHARVLWAWNPDNKTNTHGFIVVTIGKYANIKDLKLDRIPECNPFYIIDPLLKWHGPSSKYAGPPLAIYNGVLGISVCFDSSLQTNTLPAVATIEKESEDIYNQAAQSILTIADEDFPIGKFINWCKLNSVQRLLANDKLEGDGNYSD